MVLQFKQEGEVMIYSIDSITVCRLDKRRSLKSKKSRKHTARKGNLRILINQNPDWGEDVSWNIQKGKVYRMGESK